MKYVLFLMMVLFSSQAVALNCEKQPTCEELGYSTENNPNCLDDGYLICPFDFNYKKCVNFNCESLGFTKSDKSEWCADIATCKGDKSYTLCQTPCIAWDYETLSNLAESGRCKTITMKNDITIPPNQNLTLAKNTILDGNGHTLNTEKTNLTLAEGSVLQNLNIHRKPTSFNSGYLYFIEVSSHSTFENVSILDEATKMGEGWSYLCNIVDALTIKGNLKIEVKNAREQAIMNGGQLFFENAKVELIGASNILVQQESIIADNSEIYIKDSTYALNTTSPELINSQMIIESTNVCFANEGEDKHCSITLKDGSTLNTKTSNLYLLKKIIFNGTSGKTAKAVMQEVGPTTLDVQNTSAKLIYNGKTYTPTQIGTTKLSDVQTSGNWVSIP